MRAAARSSDCQVVDLAKPSFRRPCRHRSAFMPLHPRSPFQSPYSTSCCLSSRSQTPWRCVGLPNAGDEDACTARKGFGRARLPGRCATHAGAVLAAPHPHALPRRLLQRYKQLLHFAGRLAPLPAELRTREHKVEGCVSQVWVVPCLGGDGRLTWRADSDSQLTKGLAALLVEGLSGLTPEQVAAVPVSFIQDLGFAEALTPSRNNGFLNMFKLMQRRALEYCLQGRGGGSAEEGGSSGALMDEASEQSGPVPPGAAPPTASPLTPNGVEEQPQSSGSAPAGEAETPLARAVRATLQAELNPTRCCVGAGSAGARRARRHGVRLR